MHQSFCLWNLHQICVFWGQRLFSSSLHQASADATRPLFEECLELFLLYTFVYKKKQNFIADWLLLRSKFIEFASYWHLFFFFFFFFCFFVYFFFFFFRIFFLFNMWLFTMKISTLFAWFHPYLGTMNIFLKYARNLCETLPEHSSLPKNATYSAKKSTTPEVLHGNNGTLYAFTFGWYSYYTTWQYTSSYYSWLSYPVNNYVVLYLFQLIPKSIILLRLLFDINIKIRPIGNFSDSLNKYIINIDCILWSH